MSLAETQGKRAEVALWKGHVVLYALSGRGLVRDDPNAFHKVLPRESGEDLIGATLLSALNASRFLDVDDANDFLRHDQAAWEQRTAMLVTAVGAPSLRAFFASVQKCFVVQRGDVVFLTPTKRVRGPAWEAIGDFPPIMVSSKASPSQIGAALGQALSSCVA